MSTKELPAAIKMNLHEVKDWTLYGAPVLSYSKKELAAMVIYSQKKREEDIRRRYES